MKLGKLFCLWAVLALIGSVNFMRATAQDERVIDLEEVPKVKQVNPKIESVLVQLHDVFTKDRGNMTSFAKQRGMTIHSEIVWDGPDYVVWYDSVRVIFDFEDYSEENIEDLENLGVKVEASDGNLVQALVPVFQLQSVSKLSFVKYVRVPLKPTLCVVSEGVSVINATELHGLGILGAGVKVAILDLGFEGYEAKRGVELPSSVTIRSYYGDITGVAGDITGGGEVHGTACAEIVHDVAPGADLYLVNFDTTLEFNAAVDWLVSQNVKIISFSVGWVNAGPYDGTGYICNVVNDATAEGVFWAGSSGNQAQSHWEGTYQDSNVNDWHEFSIMPLDETQYIYANEGYGIMVFLSWDDWPTSNQDYDLYLLDDALEPLAISNTWQDGTEPPTEAIGVIAPYTGYYHIAIDGWYATEDVDFELYSYTHDFQYQVPSSSLVIPADAAGSFTVGATYWSNDDIESYSSQGPTNDDRKKPDVTAPAGVTNSVYGSFSGTSASAPHTAGAAALLLSKHPTLTAAQIKSDLEIGAIELGAPGKDNVFGSGRIDVYDSLLEYVVTLPVDFGTVIAGETYIQTGIITASKYANTIIVSSVVQTGGTLDALEELSYVDGSPTTGEADLPVLLFQEGVTPNVNLIDTWEPIVMLPYSKLNMEAYVGLAPGIWGDIVITFTIT